MIEPRGIRNILIVIIIAIFIATFIWLLSCWVPRVEGAEIDIVVETIAREASGESFEAQVMVAQVIITRSRERRMTYDQVCLQKWQFSCWNKGTKQKKRTMRELRIAQKAFKSALGSTLLPKVTHHYDTSIKAPYWAKSMQFVCQIGKLKFYYEERN